MDKLDGLVAEHIAERVLQPERLEEILASVLDRRQERAERRRDHLRALAQRGKVADREVRIIGSKSKLLKTLFVAAGGRPG